jgi:biopolymer transport protein ExbD
MALKKPFKSLDTFSMSSMTDVIFLLLIFFMVTSTIFVPSAIDVNLPESSEETTQKPVTEVYLDSLNQLYIVIDRNDSTDLLSVPKPVTMTDLNSELAAIQQTDSLRAIALYADSTVDYGKVVRILDMAAKKKLHMVLSTRVRQ